MTFEKWAELFAGTRKLNDELIRVTGKTPRFFLLQKNSKAPKELFDSHIIIDFRKSNQEIFELTEGGSRGIALTIPENILIIDCDIKPGKDGIADYETFCTQNDILLYGTFVQDTQSGGRHYFYTYNDDDADIGLERSKKLFGSVDILCAYSRETKEEKKAKPAYIVVSPTVIDSKFYTLKAAEHIAQADKKLLDKIEEHLASKDKSKTTKKETQEWVSYSTTKASIELVTSLAVDFLNSVKVATEHEGGRSTLASVYTQLHIGFGLQRENCLELLALHYNPRCSPPFDLTAGTPDEKLFHSVDVIKRYKDKPLHLLKERLAIQKRVKEREETTRAISDMSVSVGQVKEVHEFVGTEKNLADYFVAKCDGIVFEQKRNGANLTTGVPYLYNNKTKTWSVRKDRDLTSDILNVFESSNVYVYNPKNEEKELEITNEVRNKIVKTLHDMPALRVIEQFATNRDSVLFTYPLTDGVLTFRWNGKMRKGKRVYEFAHEEKTKEHYLTENGILSSAEFFGASNVGENMFQRFVAGLFAGQKDAEAKVCVLQEFLGLSLFGMCPLSNRAVWLYNKSGSNGKSTLQAIMEILLCGAFSRVSVADSDSFGSVALRGSKLNMPPDEDDNVKIPLGRMKTLITADTAVKLTQKYEVDSYEYIKCGFLIASNTPPDLSDANDSMAYRLSIMNVAKRVTKEEDNKHFKFLVTHPSELAKVINWLVEGAKRAVDNNFNLSHEMKEEAAASLRADAFAEWCEVALSPSTVEKIHYTRAISAYAAYCNKTLSTQEENDVRRKLRTRYEVVDGTFRDGNCVGRGIYATLNSMHITQEGSVTFLSEHKKANLLDN